MVLFLSQILPANSNFYLTTILTGANTINLLETLARIDHALFEWVLFHVNPEWLVRLSNFLVADRTLAIVAIGLWLLYFSKERRMALYLLVAALVAIGVSDALASFLKATFARVRPVTWYEIFYNPYTFSFPSAHAMNSMTLAVLLRTHFNKGRNYFLLLPLLVGICRVIAHYHFPGDVLGGWFFGALLGGTLGWAWLMIRARHLDSAR